MFIIVANSTIISQIKKNVLFIAVDDMKPILGCYGDTLVQTPNIDRLASEGTTFKNAHCQQAVCGPSRASLLTGLRPDRTRIWDLNTPIRDENPSIITLPQYFKENGYETVARGKIFHPGNVDPKHDAISWSLPYQKISNPNQYLISTEKVSTESANFPDEDFNDGKIGKQGLDLLEQLSKNDKPFFLAVGFKKPHLPFVAPKKYWDLYNRNDFQLAEFQEFSVNGPEFAYQPGWELRNNYVDIPKDGRIPDDKQRELIHGYYACVSHIDAQIGLLLDKLDSLGIRKNTIIVLWGDHGWHLGDHLMWCKHSNFEQATRAPLIISDLDYPENISNSSPTEFVDIFPTLCELAGLNVPADLHGTSLVPIINASKNKVKNYAVSQYKRYAPGGSVEGYAIRTERFRYVEWIPINYKYGLENYDTNKVVARELYDYLKDPLETINAVDLPEYSDEVTILKAYMKEFLEEQNIKPKGDSTISGNFLKNASFEDGLQNWESLKCELSQNSAYHTEGKYSLKVEKRTENYSGPQQDIKNQLIANGQGVYSIEASFKSYLGNDLNVKIMVKITSEGEPTKYYTVAEGVCNYNFTTIGGKINLYWNSPIQKAFVYFIPKDGLDSYYLDNCSMVTDFETDIEDKNLITESFNLNLKNWPNPFNPFTTISFNLKKTDKVKLSIYNIQGKEIKVLINAYGNKGNNSIVWDGRNEINKAVGSGIYFAILKIGKSTVGRKLLLLK